VIHPRKEDDRMPLHMASIFGTAKATQEADIVMILQRVEGETSVEIRKNRYDGQLGKVLVDFNTTSTSFFQLEQQK
jgi:twinkle protein